MKITNKNKYGTFAAEKLNRKKIVRIGIRVLLVVILVVGLGMILFNKFNHQATPKALVEDTTKADVSTIPGWWNLQYFGSAVCQQSNCQPDADPDKDGLTNLQEYFYHTDPLNAYTVKDKLNDGQLVAAGFDPSRPGHMTFEQISTPDNTLGESLVFSSDVSKMIADLNDINKVALPLVRDAQLKIADSHDVNAYSTYATKFQAVIDKYFSATDLTTLKNNAKNLSDGDVSLIQTKAEALGEELKTVPVPIQFVQFHKLSIAFFRLLAEVIAPPESLTSTESDQWFQNAQQFLAVQQKLDLEQLRLKKLTASNP